MGISVSCIPNKKADTAIFDTNKAQNIKRTNLKQYKRYDEFAERNASIVEKTRQQTFGNQTRIQQQIPVMKEENVLKAEKLQVMNIRPVKESNNRSQQQKPYIQLPTQVRPITSHNVRFPYVQNRKKGAVSLRGRKFPKPTTMPEPLVQIINAEDSALIKFRDKASPRQSVGTLMFSTVPESVDVSVSESTSESHDKSFSADSLIKSDVEGAGMGPIPVDQTSYTVDSNSDARSYGGEASVLDYEFEGSSALTLEIDANVSDASSIYGAFVDTILTDYKCYKYCLLDDAGLEINVQVKILKNLSESLLRKAGIVPEDNPLLFGIDPSLKMQRVYDHGEDLYVVSEYDVNMTLKDVLSVSGYPELPPLAKLYITAELIKKFTNLHQQGIYMNNFGSASVLLAKDGRVCVNDFLESALQKLKHQLVAGPEFRGILEWNPLSTDGQRKKDIYRLGQVIGKLLVGNKFQHWLRSGEDVEMMLLAENVPKPILQIICRCLRSRQETVCMDEISSYASFFFRSSDLNSGRSELQQYLNFKIVVA